MTETRHQLEQKEAEIARLREALNKIACWSQGIEVSGKFDEPYSATIAREVLAKSALERAKE